MAERELAILLNAKNMASGPIKRVTKDIGTLDKVSGRAGKGVRTLGGNLKNLAAGAAIGGAIAGFAAIKSGLDSLAERENVISATEAAIRATGGAAKVSAAQVRTWSEELERATGAAVDDKAIQASANTLLRFTNITEENFQRTLTAATDLGAGMKKGPEAGAKMLGKALADPIKGMAQLRKAGVVLTAAEEKRIKQLVKGNKVQEAQEELLIAVEKRYKGAAAGAAGPYTRALNLLSDAAEDAKMALAEGFLPILTKVSDRLSKALADPKTIEDIRGLGKGLAAGFDKALDAASQIPWGTIKDAMGLAGKGAKAAFDLFNGLPPWVQTAVVTGWGLNKLTGGAVGGIVGELGKGLIKGVLGMNAGVVNINAGVVNGGGGIPGPAGAAGAAGAGAAGAAGFGAAAAAGLLTAVAGIEIAIAAAIGPPLRELLGVTDTGLGTVTAEIGDLKIITGQSQAAAAREFARTGGKTEAQLKEAAAQRQRNAAASLQAQRRGEQAALTGSARIVAETRDKLNNTNRVLGTVGLKAQRAGEIAAGAIRAKDLSVKVTSVANVTVKTSVTASGIRTASSYAARYAQHGTSQDGRGGNQHR